MGLLVTLVHLASLDLSVTVSMAGALPNLRSKEFIRMPLWTMSKSVYI